MPEVRRYFGVVIRMFYSDLDPPHFHAAYGDDEALITIETPEVLRGMLPRRAMTLVLEWSALHRDGLRANWQRARAGQPLEPIHPLE